MTNKEILENIMRTIKILPETEKMEYLRLDKLTSLYNKDNKKQLTKNDIFSVLCEIQLNNFEMQKDILTNAISDLNMDIEDDTPQERELYSSEVDEREDTQIKLKQLNDFGKDCDYLFSNVDIGEQYFNTPLSYFDLLIDINKYINYGTKALYN